MSLRRVICCAVTLWLGAQAQGARIRPKHRPPTPPAASEALPRLGDEVAETLWKHPAAKPCDVGNGETDPCAATTAGRDRVTIAWDRDTHRVTYLYSATLQTDDDIQAGDLLGIDPGSPITPFPAPGMPHRFVTVDWCDTDASLSGQAMWCAVMLPARPKSGKVLGFVQSLYLYLPMWDASPMHRTHAERPGGTR
ncbi:MAG: hypothetical protein M3O02_00510 [Acidobacteriota bacterium]|nr:hypothetical protein [Acidobacteriota bacterium]